MLNTESAAGTGKTTAVVEVILQEVARGNTVLATAGSNKAVDNMMECILESRSEGVVRVGNIDRIDSKVAFSFPSWPWIDCLCVYVIRTCTILREALSCYRLVEMASHHLICMELAALWEAKCSYEGTGGQRSTGSPCELEQRTYQTSIFLFEAWVCRNPVLGMEGKHLYWPVTCGILVMSQMAMHSSRYPIQSAWCGWNDVISSSTIPGNDLARQMASADD